MSFCPFAPKVGFAFSAPSQQVLAPQMVDTWPSVNPDLNKYHLCLSAEHTVVPQKKGCGGQQKDVNDNLEYNAQCRLLPVIYFFPWETLVDGNK